jgi:hypothetical protein
MKSVSGPGAPIIDHLPVLPTTCSIIVSKLVRSHPPSVSPTSLDYSIEVHIHTRLITASNYISALASLQRTSVSVNSSYYGHKVPMITASMCIFKLARSRLRSVSPNSLNYRLQGGMITACKCIYTLAGSQPCSVSLSSPNRHFQVHLEFLLITACCQS